MYAAASSSYYFSLKVKNKSTVVTRVKRLASGSFRRDHLNMILLCTLFFTVKNYLSVYLPRISYKPDIQYPAISRGGYLGNGWLSVWWCLYYMLTQNMLCTHQGKYNSICDCFRSNQMP